MAPPQGRKLVLNNSIVSRLPRKLVALLALVLLTACQTPSTVTIGGSDVCLIWDPIKPVEYSTREDSAETVANAKASNADILENNAERTSYCVSRRKTK